MGKGQMKEYKVKHRLGSLGDGEWMDEKDWKEHDKFVEELKKNGEYLKEVEYTLILQDSKELDVQFPTGLKKYGNKMSAQFIVLNL